MFHDLAYLVRKSSFEFTSKKNYGYIRRKRDSKKKKQRKVIGFNSYDEISPVYEIENKLMTFPDKVPL